MLIVANIINFTRLIYTLPSSLTKPVMQIKIAFTIFYQFVKRLVVDAFVSVGVGSY